jgi:cytochrome c55X
MREHLLVALAALPLTGAAADPVPERQQELIHLLRQDCGSCHGLTLKGGLGPPLLPASLDERAADGIAQVILEGVKGTPMPPWKIELAPAEALWLARQLKQGLPR